MLDALASLPLPSFDFQPAPKPEKRWVVYDDGVLGELTVQAGATPVLSRRGRLVTQEEYETRRAAMTAAHEDRLAGLRETEAAQRLQQFKDLHAAGIAEATARQLSGYDGPSGVV